MISFYAAQVFAFLSWLLAMAWVWQAVASLRGMPTLPDLTGKEAAALPPLPATEAPHITVIVPARNEEKSIEIALRSLLASTSIRLQIIAVDDRSTDRTGTLVDELAAEAAAAGGPHELRVLHVRELPAHWLGKTHAMALAAQQATTPWLLFTDGDVVFHPQALELALREAQARKTDHLILVPTLILKTTGERAMLAAMQVLAQWGVRLWKVSDPRARDFIGVGGFNLVRHEVYTQVGGFDALPMEVLEDLRFGWKIKRSGYVQRVVIGPDLVRIRWIEGVLAVAQLVEKNGFAVCRYRLGPFLLACLGMSVQALLPLAAIAAGGSSLVAGLLTYAAIALVYIANRHVTQVSPWLAVFFAPAAAVLVYAYVRSVVLALVNNGVTWRGTRYSLDELRSHAGPGFW